MILTKKIAVNKGVLFCFVIIPFIIKGINSNAFNDRVSMDMNM